MSSTGSLGQEFGPEDADLNLDIGDPAGWRVPGGLHSRADPSVDRKPQGVFYEGVGDGGWDRGRCLSLTWNRQSSGKWRWYFTSLLFAAALKSVSYNLGHAHASGLSAVFKCNNYYSVTGVPRYESYIRTVVSLGAFGPERGARDLLSDLSALLLPQTGERVPHRPRGGP